MQIKKPEVRVLKREEYSDDIAFLADCGRTCYQSFKKSSPENDRKMIWGKVFKNRHLSVFEHLWKVFEITGGNREDIDRKSVV